MKKFFVVFSILILFLSTLSSGNVTKASKKEENVNETVTLESAEQFANDYLMTVSQNSFGGWKNAKLESGKDLYDFDGNLTSYLFQVKNQNNEDQGYIIISAISEIPGLLESTREGPNPYVNVEGDNAIYVGPLLHFSKVEDTHVKNLRG